ncbi:MAG: replicative DNA helicase [Rhodospirillales bacterium]|jgi:replicative DNA helicase|nr:replicative DNA helicase [Rhodospirillales bacterium]
MQTTDISPGISPGASLPFAAGTLAGARRLPHNIDAERSLLGAILVNNAAFERVAEFLIADHFAYEPHRRVFAACRQLIERGQLVDPVILGGLLEHDGVIAEMGGVAYLVHLADSAVAAVNAGDYGRLIHDLYLRRELIGIGEEVVDRAYTGDIDQPAPSQIELAEQALFDLATRGRSEGGFAPFSASVTEAIRIAEAAHKRQGLLSGVPSGFRDLDGRLGGLHGSDLIILAGRPSMGKTALATNIAFNAARAYRAETADGKTKTVDGAVVGFFSLEMSSEQLATRILAEQTRISSDKVRRGIVPNDRFHDIVRAAGELQRLPFFIDDTPALTISAMRTRARRLKRQHNLGLIVIDYLQLIAPPAGSHADNRVQELSEITRGLKALAKELHVPVLALSQLSRAVENREDKRPQLADLRESGTIEQDADVVMFIFREQYYLERSEPTQRADETLERFQKRHQEWMERCERAHNLAEVMIAKQRHGPIGNVKLFFEGEFTRFGDLAHTDHDGE